MPAGSLPISSGMISCPEYHSWKTFPLGKERDWYYFWSEAPNRVYWLLRDQIWFLVKRVHFRRIFPVRTPVALSVVSTRTRARSTMMVTSLVHCGQWWYWLCYELLWPCLMGLPYCCGIRLKHEFHQLVDCCLGRYFSFVVGQGGLSYPYTILAYFQFSHTRYVAQASRHHTQTDTIITVKAVWLVCGWSRDQILGNGVHYINIFNIMYRDGSLLYISKEWSCSLMHSLPCSYATIPMTSS